MSVLRTSAVALAVLIGFSGLASAASHKHQAVRAQAEYQTDNGNAAAAENFQNQFKNTY